MNLRSMVALLKKLLLEMICDASVGCHVVNYMHGVILVHTRGWRVNTTTYMSKRWTVINYLWEREKTMILTLLIYWESFFTIYVIRFCYPCKYSIKIIKDWLIWNTILFMYSNKTNKSFYTHLKLWINFMYQLCKLPKYCPLCTISKSLIL